MAEYVDEASKGVMSRFREEWRAIGWWATAEPVHAEKFYAALFSPAALETILTEEYEYMNGLWRCSGIPEESAVQRPAQSETPSRRTIMESGNVVWSGSAVAACAGAISVAAQLYPEEMPKNPAEFQALLAASRTEL